MVTGRWVCLFFMAAAFWGVAGCKSTQQCPMPMGDMKVERPSELDALNAFSGEWTGTSTMKMGGSDEAITGSGTSSVKWDLDNMVLVEKGTYTMGEGEDKETMSMMGIWTWDPKVKKYRSYWFDSMGGVGVGTSTYDASTKTWNMKAKGFNPMTGGNTVGEGTMTFTGPDAMTFTWNEWSSAWKTQKIMEISGSSRRK